MPNQHLVSSSIQRIARKENIQIGEIAAGQVSQNRNKELSTLSTTKESITF